MRKNKEKVGEEMRNFGQNTYPFFQGKVNITSGSDFQLVFQGSFATDDQMVIAVDDVLLVPGLCPKPPEPEPDYFECDYGGRLSSNF